MTRRTITAADNGGVVEVAVGEQIAIELAENPTTGYRWQLDGDPGVVVDASEHVVGTGGIGGGGVRRFVLHADRPGDLGARAKLWRAWSGEGSVIERFAITLRAS
jgi:inhibitor of cysteine peptidase